MMPLRSPRAVGDAAAESHVMDSRPVIRCRGLCPQLRTVTAAVRRARRVCPVASVFIRSSAAAIHLAAGPVRAGCRRSLV